MVRISDQWAAWIELELARLDLDELEELAWMLRSSGTRARPHPERWWLR